jgi:hypothetical protein
MTQETTTQSQRIQTYGGNGGGKFAPDYIQLLGLRTGEEVDAIIINDIQHGGNGGGDRGTLKFGTDEYISDISLRSGERVDNLQFTTNKGRTLGGGGNGGGPHTLTGIRVIAIGGRSGEKLDQIAITYVENYQPSTLVEERGRFIIGFTAPGTILKEYTETTKMTSDSYEHITETMLSQQYNASVEAEYYAKVAFSTEIKYVNTELTTVKSELTEQLVESNYNEITIPPNHVGILLLNGTIMLGSDNVYWMYPTTELSYAVIATDDVTNVLDHYDLTGELSTQMPKLLPFKTEKYDYVFYQATAAE